MQKLGACHCCGLIQEIPPLIHGQCAVCMRCAATIHIGRDYARRMQWTAFLAGLAFLLYWPAILLPIVSVDQLGQRSTSSIVSGVLELYRHGDTFVATVVLVFSIIFPLVKLVLLLELSLLRLLHQRHQALTYRIVEWVGRWSMLDVLLLALLVMLIKMRSVLTIHLGVAIYAFSACVLLSMLASMVFDPHALWNEEI